MRNLLIDDDILSMIKNTPFGDWEVGQFKQGDFTIDYPDGGDLICSGIREEKIANLISAAPRLLKPARKLLSCWKQ